jgi:hypothetical protein
MSVDKHARIPQSTSNRALTSLRKSALDPRLLRSSDKIGLPIVV